MPQHQSELIELLSFLAQLQKSSFPRGRIQQVNDETVYLLLFVTGAALLLSTIYLILTRMFTKAIMHITLVLSILLNMCVPLLFSTCSNTHAVCSGICVYYWITKYYCM